MHSFYSLTTTAICSLLFLASQHICLQNAVISGSVCVSRDLKEELLERLDHFIEGLTALPAQVDVSLVLGGVLYGVDVNLVSRLVILQGFPIDTATGL